MECLETLINSRRRKKEMHVPRNANFDQMYRPLFPDQLYSIVLPLKTAKAARTMHGARSHRPGYGPGPTRARQRTWIRNGIEYLRFCSFFDYFARSVTDAETLLKRPALETHHGIFLVAVRALPMN